MSHSQLCRSEITYAHPELDASHETWLIGWGLDWFEHATRELSVSRSKVDGEFRVLVTIETRANPEDLDAWHFDLIMELAMDVDRLDIDHHRIE